MSLRLREAGIWATSIRPPTVPPGTARLRLAFTAAHGEADVDRLLDVLAKGDTRPRAEAV
jgi:8-amino-7-oxononanoate synthase